MVVASIQPCPARKVTECDCETNILTVNHLGIHICMLRLSQPLSEKSCEGKFTSWSTTDTTLDKWHRSYKEEDIQQQGVKQEN